MGSEWKEYELDHVVEMQNRKTDSININIDNYISTENMLPDKGGVKKAASLPEQEKYLEFLTGDVLVSNIRTYFKKVWKATFDGGASNDVIVFRTKNNELLDQSFLYFLLSDEKFIEYTVTTAKGTKMPRGDKAAMKKYKFRLPGNTDEQKAIAHILGSLDNKIELNRQMNQTLEQMAQALFKSWFVDFDPVIDNALAAGNEIPEPLQKRAQQRKELGDSRKPLPENIQNLFPVEFEFSEELDKWVPEGWKVVKLEELAEVKYGKDHKKLNDGNIPVYGSGGIMRYADQSLYNGESVLIPRKGTLSNIMYVNEAFWSVDTMFYTVLKIENYAKFLYYRLKQLDFENMNVGSAVPSMTTAVLNALYTLVPDPDILKVFEKELTAFYIRVEANKDEIQSLTKIRDTLLPKLVSGEVRVPEGMLAQNTESYE